MISNSFCTVSGTPFCVANTCQATQDPCAGVNCPGGTRCNPANSMCESTSTGGHISCGSSSCPSSSAGAPMDCDSMTNTCYDPSGTCTADSDCISGMTCNGILCIGCATTGYCPGGGACFPIPGFDFCI